MSTSTRTVEDLRREFQAAVLTLTRLSNEATAILPLDVQYKFDQAMGILHVVSNRIRRVAECTT